MSGTGFSGNPVFFLFCPFIHVALHGKAVDSRLKMSGMTAGRLKTSGMTAGAIEHVGHDGGRVVPDFACLCHARRSPLCQSRRFSLLSCPPVLPSVNPAGSPFCHSRRFLAGIQCFFLLSLHSCGPAWESLGFPIKDVGNDTRGIVCPRLPPLSCPPVPPSVIPAGF